MLKDSIKELALRYSFKEEFGKEMPDYFEALDDGIQSMNAQLQAEIKLKEFKIKHGREDMIPASEAADLLESILIRSQL